MFTTPFRPAPRRTRLPVSTGLGALLVLLVSTIPVTHAADKSAKDEGIYTLAVFPHLATGHIENIYARVAERFSRALGRPVRFRTKPTFADFTAELRRESYDIALIQPFDYVLAHDKHNYLPLARRGEPLSGQIAVMPDSEFKTLADLKRKTIALPPEDSAVSHLVRFSLLKVGINPDTDVALKHHRSHDSCLQQLLIGEVQACGTAAYPLRFFEDKWGVKFRVLASTDTIPHTLFVVHRRVPSEHRDKLLQEILSWSETEDGRELLKYGALKPFLPATDKEYGIVREYFKLVQRK